MTNIASKHGLRAAAKERRNKHDQRTPLPPKSGRINAAKEAIAEAKAIQALTPDPLNQEIDRVLTAAPDTKSGGKARAFAEAVGKFGWTVAYSSHDEETEVTATRGEETLYLRWDNGVFQPPSTYTIGQRTINMRNASQAKQYAARPVDTAQAELDRVTANKAFKRRTPPEAKSIRLPFDPKLATDEEVLTNLLGKPVSWTNRISNSVETAVIGKDLKRIRITTSSSGERIVNFCCSATGFRSFRVADLRRVGGRVKALTKGESNARGGIQHLEIEEDGK